MNIDRIIAAQKAIRDHLEKYGEPMREFRIHPDDYKDLLAQIAPCLVAPSPGAHDSILGIPVVIDEKAERVPRQESK